MKYYIVDAFAEKPGKIFSGNPAGVCLLEKWPEDHLMQAIAAENNLAETAFIVKSKSGYDLRWFTPELEVDLCGHATLAAAFVVANFMDPHVCAMPFATRSGILTVVKNGDLYEMDFPSRPAQKIDATEQMKEAIGARPLEAYLARDLMLLLETEEQVRDLQPDFERIKKMSEGFAVIVTAKGRTSGADFVSRFFAPKAGIPEDPVTGSSHSTLIPFWSARLGKKELAARQLSKRGGTLYCEDAGERVKIAGHAALYLEGNIQT